MENNKLDDGIYTAEYIGKPMMGYQPKKTYQINIEKNGYVYNVEAIDAAGTKMIQYASEISIKQKWKFIAEK